MNNPLTMDFFNVAEEVPYSVSLVRLLRKRAQERPRTVGFTFLVDGEDEEVSVTYEELDLQARAIGSNLQCLNASGERALLIYPPGLEFIAGFLGCLYAGVVAAPIYPPDPARLNRSLPRLQSIAADAAARFVLTTSPIISMAQSMFAQIPDLKKMDWLCHNDLVRGPADGWRQPDPDKDTLAFLQYTSGSTGDPKGVMLTHQNLLHNAALVYHAFEHSPGDKYVSWLPTFHDMGLMAGVLEPLFAGIPAILMSPLAFLQRPDRWLRTISRFRATVSGGPNFAYDLCTRKISPEQRATLDLRTWSLAFNGAEPVGAETLDRFVATFKECGFRREAFLPCYGLAEATLIVSATPKSAPPRVKSLQARALGEDRISESVEGNRGIRHLVSCGNPLNGQEVLIANPDSLIRCQDGQVGEIWVSGPSVAQGYWRRPDETRKTFSARPEGENGATFLRTGDLGFLQDGDLYVAGRLKDLIIIRGLNHYPQDIERTVEESYPAFRAGCGAAFSIEGGGAERLVVAQEIDLGREPDIDEAIASIRRNVSEEHDLECYGIVILRPGTIFKTSSGKIQRRACRAAFLQGALSDIKTSILEEGSPGVRLDHQDRRVILESPVELQPALLVDFLFERATDVLHVAPSLIDPQAPLTVLGMDSLAAVELRNEVEASLGVELPLTRFIQGASISQLARELLDLMKQRSSRRLQIPIPSEEGSAGWYPLSQIQQSLWFLYQLAPESGGYNNACAAKILSAINVDKFQRAFETIVTRHPCLRTIYSSHDGRPVQSVCTQRQSFFEFRDCSNLETADLDSLLGAEADKPFNLEWGPIFRVLLFRRSAEEHVILIVAHHIAMDGWSFWNILDELRVLYAAEIDGAEAILPALPVGYSAYVRWQTEMLAGSEGERLWAYWAKQLDGELPVLNLPTDRRRPPTQTYRGQAYGFMLAESLTNRIKAFASDDGSTIYCVLVAAFFLLLHRYTSQEDILLGSPTSARSRAEFENIVGCFFNALVLRADFNEDRKFRDFLHGVRGTVLEALDHQELPSNLISERLKPARDVARPPLFQATFIFQKPHKFDDAASIFDYSGPGVNVGGLTLKAVPLERKHVRTDLELEMIETSGSLQSWLSFNSDLLDDATIQRMARQFETLLEGIVSSPDQLMSDVPLLTAAELSEVTTECNRTEKDHDRCKCVHELFEVQVNTTPDSIAVCSSSEQMTYFELNRRANWLAHRLIALGVRSEAIVTVYMTRSAETLVGLLGVLKSGGAYLPLDPASPPARVQKIVDDAGSSLLLTHRSSIETVGPTAVKVIRLDKEDENDTAARTLPNPGGRAAPGNLAYVIYTSGSTGEPKGVMIEHASLTNYAQEAADNFGLGTSDCVLQFASISFDASAEEIYPCLIRGGKLFPRRDEMIASPAGFLNEARTMGVTVVDLPTAYWHELIASMSEDDWARMDNLRLVIIGGERAIADRLLTWQQRSPSQVRLLNTYGPTEATIVSTLSELSIYGAQASGEVSIGTPVANARAYVLDKHGHPAPLGVIGDLRIGGAGLCRAYLNRPELTAENLIPDAFATRPGLKLYKTGDLARRLSNGSLEFAGRADHQVKVRGFRIELGEIEATLGQHAAIDKVIVVAREDSPGDTRLVAYATLKGVRPSSTELRAFLNQRLPVFMAPSAFVWLDEFPITAGGKLDRRVLPAPESGYRDLADDFSAPHTAEEEIIIAICSDLLGLDRLGVDEDLFSLGCHSLLATRIVARLREAFQIELPLVSLFENPTVYGLAAAVKSCLSLGPQFAASAIPPAPRDGYLPLSFSQERLWFLCKLDPNNTAYYIPRAIRINGPFSGNVLEAAFTELVRLHEILRTTFPLIAGRPVQLIHPPLPFDAATVDFSELWDDEREAWVGQLILEQGGRPFDLESDMLLRILILRLRKYESVMVLTEHHLVHDGWTQGVLVRNFLDLYAAFASGAPSPLPEPALQYADFAYWQRQWMSGELLKDQLSYWVRRLAGAPPVLELPTDRPRPRRQTFRGIEESLVLDAELASLIRDFSRKQGATLFMTMFAAFTALLYKYTAQEDILVGSGIANRRWVEMEGMLGMIINTLVLRTDLGGNPTPQQLLQRVRTGCLQAYGHQDLPFEKLVEELKPQRTLSHNPIFQVMFSFMDAPSRELTLPGLALTVMDAHNRSAKFDLNIVVIPHSEQLVGQSDPTRQSQDPAEITVLWEYSTDIFERSTMARMLGHYRNLLLVFAKNPVTPIGNLTILTMVERTQLLVEWNNGEWRSAREKCLHELFEEQAEKTPEAVVVEFEGKLLTYRELNRRSNQVAHYLRELGLHPDARVGLCLERSVEMVVGILGTLKAGGGYVPLEPGYPQERLEYIILDSCPMVVLTQVALEERLGKIGLPIFSLDENEETLSGYADKNPGRFGVGLSPKHLAYVIYTSGSTGRPKGVMNEHAAILNGLLWARAAYRITNQDRFLQKTSFTFDVSVWEFLLPLLIGARLVVARQGGHRDPQYLARVIEEKNITTVLFVPSAFQMLLEQEATEASCRGLRRVLCSGEALSYELQQRFAASLPGIELHNLYGPTEAAIHVTTWRCQSGGREGPVPIGRPIANLRMYVLDKNLQPAPIGVVGELHIAGAGVARGYWNRTELTAERFVPDGYGGEPGARMYRTGDLGRWGSDGSIEFLGRNDFQVKIRGFRIELEEIEGRLAEHEGVKEAVVVAREDGSGGKRLVAYYVAAERTSGEASGGESGERGVGAEELRRYLAERLPEYMVPVAYVRLERMPLTVSGKLDRKGLPGPEGDAYGVRRYEAPAGEVERMLAGIWGELLRVEGVGREDNFFDIGGHSLLATRVMSRLREVFGVELGVGEVFERPTVAGLAEAIEEERRAGRDNKGPGIERVRRGEGLPLSYAQQRLWFIQQLEPESTAYNIPYEMRMVGLVDIASLEQGLSEIVRRQEVLRTRFVAREGEPVQVVEEEEEVRLGICDVSELREEEREEKARELGRENGMRAFNIGEGPVWRASVLRVAAEEQVMVMCTHHVASDGWSVGVMVREMSELYECNREGKQSGLGELSIQYGDYAVWQREWLQGEVLEEQLRYWREQLRGVEVLELPTDRARPAVASHVGGRVGVRLGKELTEKLREVSRREGMTVFMTVLAGFQVLMSRYSGQEDIAVGTPIANRNWVETEGLIGFFVNMLVMRGDISGNPRVEELLRRVREVALGAYGHQEVPFEKVVEAMEPERDLGREPLFQVMVIMQNAPVSELRLRELQISGEPTELPTAKYEMTLMLTEEEEELRGVMEYASELYDREQVERQVEHLKRVMGGMVGSVERGVMEIELMSEGERQQVVEEWNDTVEWWGGGDKCVHELFEEQVERASDAVAVVYGESQLSYGELNRRANLMAHYLTKRGLGPEMRVGLCVERSPEMVTGMLGILKSGGGFVPLDPEYPVERLKYMVKDADARVIVTKHEFEDKLGEDGVEVIRFGEEQDALSGFGSNNHSAAAWSSTAYTIYTSGSTGHPKGVIGSHRATVNRMSWMWTAFPFGAGEVCCVKTSMNFVDSIWEIFGPVLKGVPIVLIGEEVVKDAKEFVRTLTDNRVTRLVLVPSLLRSMIDSAGIDLGSGLPELKYWTSSGEVLPREVIERFRERRPGDTLLNLYGSSEVAGDATCRVVTGDASTAMSIGRPISNTRISILSNQLELVPIGVPGELGICGDSLSGGYLNRPELTAERFVPHPFGAMAGGRLYRSGDLGRYLELGELEYIGRLDNQIKIRGFRIEPGEIEAALSSHPAVRESLVLMREQDQGERILVAYITAKSAPPPSVEDLRSFLKQRLPLYMVPSLFVGLDALPLTPHGKVDRSALPGVDADRLHLRQGFHAPMARGSSRGEWPRPPLRNRPVPPSSRTEQMVAEIWRDLLGIEDIGVQDDFFELGGHSLMATKLMSRIQTGFGVEIPLQIVFTDPTIAALAARIEEAIVGRSSYSRITELLNLIEKAEFESRNTADAGESLQH